MHETIPSSEGYLLTEVHVQYILCVTLLGQELVAIISDPRIRVEKVNTYVAGFLFGGGGGGGVQFAHLPRQLKYL